MGATVDTEAPKVAISYPPAASAVNGTFVLAGTCSDDKGVTRIAVRIKNLDTGTDYGTLNADIKDSLTWTVSLNKNTLDASDPNYSTGWAYPDGKYQFSVTAYDKSGRSSGENAVQLELDNTPPVFVISKPGVVRSDYLEKNSLSKYGSLFTIEGTIADDHSIAKMDVSIFDKDGNPVNSEPYTEEEISTTGGTSVTIARYVLDGQDEVNNRYNAIYSVGDADSSGNKAYSCKITLSDSSKKYTNPGDSGVSEGNTTSVVYLYDDIYDDYMSTKKGAGLSANDFRSVLNGTATDDQLSGKGVKNVTVSELNNALKTLANDTSSVENKSLAFSLNPDADPTYTISGFSLSYTSSGATLSDNTNKAMGEQPVTVIISAGLDQVNIVPSSLKVWVKKISEPNKNPVSQTALAEDVEKLVEEVKRLELAEKINSTKPNYDLVEGWYLVHSNSDDASPTDKTVSISTEIPGHNYVENDAYYALVVTGHDKDDIDLSQNKLYGFKGTISAVPPSVSITSPDDLSYFASSKYKYAGSETDKLEFIGTATENNAGMKLRALKASLSVTDELTGTAVAGSDTNPLVVSIEWDSENETWTSTNGLTCEYDEDKKTNIWKFVPSECAGYEALKAEAEGLSYLYTVTVEATGTAELTNSDTRKVHIDTTKPEVTITSVTPTVSGSEYFGESSQYKDYTFVNGTISIKGNINEQNLDTVTYDVWASSDLNAELTKENTILEGLRDFVKGLVAQGTLPANTQEIDGDLGRLFLISKEFSTELVTKYFITSGKITEDQPIKARIVLEAKDTVGNIGKYNSSDSNDGKDFIIYQETNRPKITLGNASTDIDTADKVKEGSNLFGTTNNNKLSISFSDDDAVRKYEVYLVAENVDFTSTPYYTDSQNKTTASINLTLPSEEGKYKVKIRAIDFLESETNTAAGNPTGVAETSVFYIAVDSGAPTLSITNPQNGNFISRQEITDVTGTVSKREGTEITGFIYKYGDAEKTSLVPLTNVVISDTAVNDVYTWTGKLNMSTTTDDSFKFQVTAEDSYEQKASITLTLGIDERAPTLTIKNGTEDAENITGSKKLIKENNPNYSIDRETNKPRYLISGTWSDEYKDTTTDETIQGTGTDTLYYDYAYTVDDAGKHVWKNGYTPKTETESQSGGLTVSGVAKSSAETSFNFYIPLEETEKFAFVVYATDKAGNKTEPIVYDGITVDLSAPTIKKTSGNVPQYRKSGEKLTITGTCADSFGLEDIVPTVKLDGTAVSSGQKGYTFSKTISDNKKTGSFTITVTPQEDQDHSSDGNWTFEIKAVDLAGRESGTLNENSIVDTVAPVWGADSDFTVDEKPYTYTSASEHSWYKAAAMPFTGKLTEGGSGIKKILYSVISAGSASTTPTYAESILTAKGSNGIETFEANLSGFKASLSPNKVYMKAVDEAGNESTPKEFFIYRDAEAPVSEECDKSGTIYSDKKTEIPVTGRVSDDASGVNTVNITVADQTSPNTILKEIPTSLTNAGTNNWNWTAKLTAGTTEILSELDEGHTYVVKAVIEDKAGNSSTSTIFRIQVDTTAPYVQTSSLSYTTKAQDYYKVYNPSANTYYVNSDGNTFTISGVAMDSASGVKSVKLVLTNTKDSSKKIERSVNNSVFTWTDIDFTDWEDGATGEFTVTDNAGNTGNAATETAGATKITVNISFDNDAPQGIHAIDKSNKDIFFRVGDSNSYKEVKNNGVHVEGEISADDWNDEIDLDVGGKYSSSSYGKNQTVRVRGNIQDSGSGIEMIYYKVISNGATEMSQGTLDSKADAFLSNYASDNTGYFKPNSIQTKRVAYTPLGTVSEDKVYDTNGDEVALSGTVTVTTDPTYNTGVGTIFKGLVKDFATSKDPTKRYATITTNYDNSFTGFKDGYNYLILVAIDNVGNKSIDEIYVVKDGGKIRYSNSSLNVDTVTPSLKSNTTGTVLANGNSDITFGGTFSDNFSGVKTVKIELVSDEDESVVKTITLNKDSPAANFNGTAENGEVTKAGTWETTIASTDWSSNVTDWDDVTDLACSVNATVTDKAGNEWSQTIFKIQIDKTDPEFNSISLSQVSSTYKVYKASENSYYVNPNDGTFTFKGVATDNFGVEKVELFFGDETTASKSSTGGSFEFKEINLKSKGVTNETTGVTSVSAKLKVTDKAGNSVENPITITFDTTPPSLNSTTFRIADKEYVTTGGAKNWFKDSLLKFTGNYTEAGCGIEEVQYTITKAGTGATQSGSFATTALTGNDAGKESFSANLSEFIEKETGTTGNEWNTVKFVAVDKVGNANGNATSGGNEYIIYIDTTAPDAVAFESETPYTNGKQSGNLPKISGIVEDTNAGLKSFAIKVNNKTITTDDSTNGSLTLTKTGTVGEGTSAVTCNDNKWYWEVEIKHSAFADLPANTESKNFSVYAVVSDTADNSQSVSVANVIADNKAPTVELTAPTDRDSDTAGTQINGTITLEGKISDKNVLPTNAIKKIRYNTTSATLADTSTDWTDLASVSGITLGLEGSNTFTVTGFDTTKLAEGTYYIQAVAEDSAGNTGYSSAQTVIIAQDSDRPKVTISNLTNVGTEDAPSYILKFGTNAQISGIVKDDDETSTSIVKEFIATTSPLTATTNVTSTTDSAGIVTSQLKVGTKTVREQTVDIYDITTFNPKTGDWTFTPANGDDGPKTVNFYVKDNPEKIFYTGNATLICETTTTATAQPYYQVKTEAKSLSSAATSYRSDSEAPTVSSAKVRVFSDAAGTTRLTDASGNNVEDETLSGSVYLGGSKKRYVKFIVQSYDANGIASMSFTLKGKAKDAVTIGGKSYAKGDAITLSYTTPSTFNGTSGTSESSPAEWLTPVVDLSVFESGSIACTAAARDTSDLPGNMTPTFNVDNTPPVISITSPSSTSSDEERTGTIVFGGTSIDSGKGTAVTSWLIPSTTDAGKSDSELAALTVSDGTTSLWNSTYDSGKTANTWQFTLSTALSAYDNATYAGTNIDNGVYTLPFYVMAEDELGNYTIKKDYTFKHNPDADRPKTEVIYPNETSYVQNENHVTLSGSIRISGSAIIPSSTTSVAAVYLQIENGTATTSGNTTTVNYTDSKDYITGLAKKSYTAYTATTAASDLNKTLQFADGVDSSNWWGIKAEKTSAWSCTINDKEEMKPEGTAITYIRFRACAVSENGKVGTWTPWYNINIDNNAPSQTATLYQFKTTQPSAGCTASTILAESNIKARNIYEGDMYLKGDWYLAIKVWDNSNIATSATTVTSKTGTAVTSYASTVTGGENEPKEQYLFIKVESSETYTVNVSDGENTVKNVYYLNRDDTAPTIESVYKGSDSTATANHLAEYTSTNTQTNTVEDENYIYALGGRARETGSGFKRLVFYYVRANSGTNDTSTPSVGRTYTTPVVLDPMITTGDKDSKAAITSNLTDRTFTQDDNTYHLYAKKVEGTLGADGYTFTPTTASHITGNAHIRVGGMIEAGGVLRRIESISTAGVVTFDTNTGVKSATDATVYFPYAQVVDNTVAEVTDDTLSTETEFRFKNDSPDDGDGMPEAIKGNSSSGYSWEASIHSGNMPDGPCALVVLAFDAAGNVSGKTYKIDIKNRAPRLAKLWLGTDLNSNDVWNSEEFVGYNLHNGTSEIKDYENQSIATATFGSAFKVKKNLAVISEFVGGNGSISMVYKKGANTTSPVAASSGTTATADAKVSSADDAALITSLIGTSDEVGTVVYHGNNKGTSLKGFTLTSEQVAGVESLTASNGNAEGVNASFTFWDQTDENANQSFVLHISDLTLALVDKDAPKVVINPFYWDGVSSNSIYGSSTATKNSDLKGHIELEGDLTGTRAATLYGADPKVSGKITFTGTAYDDHTLKNLKFTLSRPVTTNNTATETAYDGFYATETVEVDGQEQEVIVPVTMATYDPTSSTNGGWSAVSGNSGSTIANGGKFEWTISTTSTTEEINARKYGDTCYLSQEGHKIYWTITIDTEQISDVAATDVKLTVTATDGANQTSANATATGDSPAADKTDAKENHVPVYQMDVVPYITKVYTQISKNAGEEFARSATGRYSMNKAETFRLFGFNLDKTKTNNTVNTSVTFTADGSTTGRALTVSLPVTTNEEDKAILEKAGFGSHIKVAATNATTKGSLKVTVNGVSSLNNDNADPYFTENDTRAYNSQANGITNNLLNDDVKIYLWTTGAFDTIMSGHGANVTSPMMKFDPSGNYYISYGQGANLFAINKYNTNATGTNKNTDTTLESCYNKYHNTNVAYDGSGNFYGVATDTDRVDTSTTGATSFTFFSRALGKLIDGSTDSNNYVRGNYYNGSNKRRLELSQYGGAENSKEDTGTYNINRVQRPKLTVSGNAASAKVYMAYFDSSAKNVKFRYGTVTGTEDYSTDWQGRATLNSKMTGGISNNLSGNGTDSGTNASSASGYHLIATNSTTYKGGAYTAVGYTRNGDAVVAWYDAANRQLVFSYNTTPQTATTETGKNTNGTEKNVWQRNATVIDTDYSGWYVDLAVDANDGIHIAYYKSSSGDLKYAYISDYTNAASSKTVVTVDSYLSVGTNITINVKALVPYIYYYNTSANQTTNSIKVAWQNKTTLAAGADNDKFTGNWECMTIPTNNIPNDATVSGGVPTAGTYQNKVILGYMTDQYFEKAELQ